MYIDSCRLVQKRLLIVFLLHYCCFSFILDGKINIPHLLPLFVPVYNMPALKLQKRSTRLTCGSIINILQGMETFFASMLNTELKIKRNPWQLIRRQVSNFALNGLLNVLSMVLITNVLSEAIKDTRILSMPS